MSDKDTITAISTPPGTGAIAVIRLSGESALEICEAVFVSPADKELTGQDPNTLHYGTIRDEDEIIDEVVVGLFKAPHSYTGENLVEISCHGSVYIQKRILELLVSKGARLARPGEFTMRAFMNGKLDLTQVEAVADLIASGSKAAHRVAMSQMRGGFTEEIKKLRDKLLTFISLLELELDFSEEDVEFADRSQLKVLLEEITRLLQKLKNSFSLGNVIKNGVPVAIAGKTNSGKSTLLNLLLREEKAIVSEIEGTTRDAIEDLISIQGIHFRLIDTAGIRHTEDAVEKLGIARTLEKIRQAVVVIHLLDARLPAEELILQIEHLEGYSGQDEKKRIIVLNKIDLIPDDSLDMISREIENHLTKKDYLVSMSAKKGIHLDRLEKALIEAAGMDTTSENDVIITNVRHYEALDRSLSAVRRAVDGLDHGIAGDLLAQDIRETIHYLSEITGEITDNEILGNIFKNFCIGK
ncbi:MAG: tRNA uridine-5-carboxymethylaminomethyl(34) synthesis GTPase MnmE [Bacteroidales bacterium]|nr:tRNA uridine-5-carboxymethylaminomethyl(34) synthesis GTPase MnmE [Bacteroidales bacterium]